jgi:hypothetical protein
MAEETETECEACGAPVGDARFCAKCGADQEELSVDRDFARMRHREPLRTARKTLLVIAVLAVAGSVYAFATGGEEATAILVVGLMIAAVYAALWQWAKRQPLGATAAALGILVTLWIGNAAMEPGTLLNGFVLKIIIVILLIRGVRAGVALRSHELETR